MKKKYIYYNLLLVSLCLIFGANTFAQHKNKLSGSAGKNGNPSVLSDLCVLANQQESAVAGTCVNCSIINPQLAVDQDENTYSTLSTSLAGVVGGAVSQTLQFPNFGSSTDSITIAIGSGNKVLNAQLLGSVSITTFNGTVSNNDTKSIDNSNADLLDGTSKYLVRIKPTQAFNKVQITLNTGVIGALNTLDIYYACVTPKGTNLGKICNTLPVAYSTDKNGLCLLCSINNPELAVDNTETTYSEINIGISALNAYASETIIFPGQIAAGNDVFFVISSANGGGLLNATVLGNASVATYNGGVSNNDRQNLIVTNLSLLDTSAIYLYRFTPKQAYDRVELRLNGGLVGALSALRIHQVCSGSLSFLPPPPPPKSGVCVEPVSQTTDATAGCLLCGVDNPNNAIDGNDGTFAAIHVDASIVNAYTSQTYRFAAPAAATDSISIAISGPSGVATAQLLGDITIQSYLGNTANNDLTVVGQQNASAIDKEDRYLIRFKPGKAFDKIELRLNGGLVGGLKTVNVYYICKIGTVNNPANNCTSADSTTTAVTGTCLSCSVVNPNNAVDNISGNYSELSLGLSILNTSVSQTLIFPSKGLAGDHILLTFGNGSKILSANALGNVSLRTYNGSTPNNDSASVNVNNVALLDSYNNIYTYKLTPTQDFDRVEIKLIGAVVGALDTIRLYGACLNRSATPPPPQPPTCVQPNGQSTYISPACLVCGVDNANDAIDGNDASFSSLHADVSAVNGYVSQFFYYATPSVAGDSISITVENPAGIISIGLLSSVNIRSYLGNTANNDTATFGQQNIRLLDGSGHYVLTFKPAKQFDKIELRLNGGLVGALNRLNVFYFCKIAPGASFNSCLGANQETDGTSGTCVGCSVANPKYSVDNISNNYTTLNLGLSASGAYVYQRLKFPKQGNPGDKIYLTLATADSVVGVSALGSIGVGTFNRGVYNNDSSTVNTNNLTLVDPANHIYNYVLKVNYPFDEVEIRLTGGVVGAVKTLRIYGACLSAITIPADPFTGNCTGGVTQQSTISTNCTNCTIDKPDNLVDGDASTFSTIKVTQGLPGEYAQQVVTFPIKGCATDSVAVLFEIPTAADTTGMLQSLSVASFNDTLFNNDRALVKSAGLKKIKNNLYTYTYVPGAVFNKLEIRLNSIASGGLTTVYLYGVCSKALPDAIISGNSTAICYGTSATLVAVIPPNSGITWYDKPTSGAVLQQGTTYVTPLLYTTTTYYIQKFRLNTPTCVYAIRKPVTVNVLPDYSTVIDFTIDSTNIKNATVKFTPIPSNGVQYKWDFGDGTSSTEAEPTHTYHKIGKFSVKLEMLFADGCKGKAIKYNVITIYDANDGTFIFVPNTFTPNGDGRNDYFIVRGKGIIGLEFNVYNQWGELIFNTTNTSEGWDGTFRGEAQPVGVYVYYVKAKLQTGKEVTQKGSITLVR